MKLLKPLWVAGKRQVSTWSPLATAFNTRPTSRSRPMFDSLRERTGLFNKPELLSFEGFNSLKEQAIAATDRLIDEATSNPTRPMVDIFDELSDTLCKVADLAEFVRIAHPQPHFASAAEEACISVSGVVEKLNTHKGLYEALRDSVKRGTCGDRHLAELFLFDFEQSGIQLPDGPRQRVVALNDLILQTGQQFMAGAAKPRRVPRAAIPQNVRQFFSSEGEHVTVSGVYAECGEAAAREAAYRLYLAPDARQEQLLCATLRARHQLADLCGFQCYADRAIKASTMETSSNVRQFLDILSDNLHDRANIDFEAMTEMKRKETPYQKSLMCWDTPYFTHKAKTQLLNVASSDFNPYFSLGACMEGLNMLCQELYGITLQSEQMLPGESWSPDVYKLAVVAEDEGLLGHIYCDLYERPGKPHQDCHFTIQGGKLLPDGSYQNPIVVVMLSLSGGHRSGPALLGPGAVDNLFHEVGHAMHSMLARANHQHVAGTRCATDLAELPSVLMEHFAACPDVVRRFARHFQTGAPMPEDMLQRLCASKHLFGASEMQLQNPIVVVMLSLSGGHRSGPALLGPGAVDNLFHEVGHAMHSMLARANHQHVAGTRCATDLAELPSVLMEHFAACPDVVRRFARHFQTGAPMPEDMLQRLCASKHLFGASEMQLQVFYSALDQQYHGCEAAQCGDTTHALRQVQKQYYGLPYVDNTAWQHRFSHLIGYGAKYYSYLISRALAWAVWRKHFAHEPLSRSAGAGLRHGLLRHGGSIPPQILLRDYLETEITPHTLAMALTEELDYHKDHLDTVFKVAAK
ncbi:jg13585 [Pararge aegeria aegeria]|uniref:Jg13585 protein n=1 Tax=Pararge aegeria aegeria TaxID=348720 RepID=A0A8S4QV07_9NEOP|nr:jg13585 [Pararge aegeria aegeria]